jgi:hypothetical protein
MFRFVLQGAIVSARSDNRYDAYRNIMNNISGFFVTHPLFVVVSTYYTPLHNNHRFTL